MGFSENRTTRSRRYRWILAFVPVTLHPKIIGFKNRYLTRKSIGFSDICALCMTALLMVGLYYGTSNTLRELNRSTLQGDVGHSLLYGFSFGLFMLIFLSAAVTGLSNLFMARDVDLLLASPVADTSFLRGKVLEVLVSTTWMILVFSIPPYVAFGGHFGADVSFFLLSPLFVGLFLLLAVLAGMSVAIICSSLIPARTGRNILVALFVMVLGGILALVNTSPTMQLHTHLLNQSADSGVRFLIRNPLLPSTWLSDVLLGLIAPPATLSIKPVVLLGAAIVAVWFLLITTFRLLYRRGYGRLHTQPQACVLFCRAGTRRSRLLSFRPWQTPRALATRELFSFGRDITHTVQLALFLTICILYFINFHNISAPIHVGAWVLRAWDLIAIVSFITISSLIILSICARFVFPSVSLEGASLWILQVAPITPRALLRAKYFTWALPLGAICAVLFSSAGLALALEPICILSLGLAACIITHGLVALGIGLGARFSRFDWEHPAELATSWGSLLFLVAGLVTLAVSFVPLCATFGCYIFFPNLFDTTNNLLALFSAGLGVLLLINIIIGKIALKIGLAALSKVLAGCDELRNA
jgi:hypothetical protein